MYLFFVLTNLLYWWEFGYPAKVVIPVIWVAAIAAEMFLQIKYTSSKHRRRALTYLSLGMCAVCEIALWLMQNELAMAIYVSYHMAAAVLVASVVGKIGYAVMEHLRLRREKTEKNDEE